MKIQFSTARLVNSGKKALAMGFVLAAFTAAGLVGASPAHAGQTFEVNNTGDPVEGDPSFGVCNVQLCTLRTAIIAANNHPGPDTIEFNIPNAQTRDIAPVSELPAITEAVTIDGYSQLFTRPNTRSVGYDGRIDVQLRGSKAGSAADGLVIKANDVTVRGLAVHSFDIGIQVRGERNSIEGNFIGLDRFGRKVGNRDGVFILDGRNNSVGGTAPAERNVVSGNVRDGVRVFGTSLGTDANKVQNNHIGTDKFGTGALGNGVAGVSIFDSSFNAIGGASSAEANIIAFNAGDGVALRSGNNIFADLGNSIRSNSIHSNGDLGIDLRNDGVTANDPGDLDTGENNLQNKPDLTSAVASGGTTIVQGRLDGAPNRRYFVEFFSNPSGDEGRTLLGRTLVTTDAGGDVEYTFTTPQEVAAGQLLTATATDQGRNTSEFSAPLAVASQ